ncbi:MAG: biotin carboxylase [Acidimicrobiales bacterium]|nr:biotin carboxylase [Acidimicrobiales bacterium]
MLPTSTYRATDFVEAAAALGATVVVASDREQLLAATDRALTVDLHDADGTAAAVEALDGRTPVDAIVAVDDQGVVVAAEAAARLGLPHNPPEAVAATRDKSKLRQALGRAEVRQPSFRLVEDDQLPDLPFPWVVKPLGLSGSTGVIRVDDADAAPATFERVRTIAGDERAPLLVETFVAGPEVAIEGLLRDGVLEVLAVFDKPDPLDGPYFEETIYVTPSRHPAADLAEVRRLAQQACTALGLTEGPVHAEARLSPEGPVLLEVAARSIGGLCARTLRFGAGVSLEELILRHALGLPTDGLVREDVAAGVMMLPIPASGTLREVGGQDEARAVPGVVGLEITVPKGRAVRTLPEGDRYLGFLFARGDTPAEVEAALRSAHACLDVVVDQRVVD